MDLRFVTKRMHAYLDYPVAVSLVAAPFFLGLGSSHPLARWLAVGTGIVAFRAHAVNRPSFGGNPRASLQVPLSGRLPRWCHVSLGTSVLRVLWSGRVVLLGQCCRRFGCRLPAQSGIAEHGWSSGDLTVRSKRFKSLMYHGSNSGNRSEASLAPFTHSNDAAFADVYQSPKTIRQ